MPNHCEARRDPTINIQITGTHMARDIPLTLAGSKDKSTRRRTSQTESASEGDMGLVYRRQSVVWLVMSAVKAIIAWTQRQERFQCLRRQPCRRNLRNGVRRLDLTSAGYGFAIEDQEDHRRAQPRPSHEQH